MAGSGPVRSVRRSRLDAAVCAAASDGLSGHDARSAQGVQAMGIENTRPSRIRAYAGRRNDDGSAGAGHRHGGRHGAGGAPVERPLRRRFCRPPYLRDRGRRLPDGRAQPRSDLAGRSPPAQPADRAVRRQPNLDRRIDVAVVFGRPACALQGIGLVSLAHRWPRSRNDRSIDREREAKRPAFTDRVPYHHRIRRAEPAGHRKSARCAARCRRGREDAPGAQLAASAL